jgi:hypothetical protein
MSSKAFRAVINGVPHLINLNHITKVTLKENTLKFYLNANNGLFGMSIYGSGFVSGNDLMSFEVNANSKEEATKMFEELAKLM